VFGNDCADAAKIDNNEKETDARRVRERIRCKVVSGRQKAGYSIRRMQGLNSGEVG